MDLPGYKIIRHIGQETFTDVYLAIQLSVGREVCLKIIDTHKHKALDIRQSLENQASSLKKLSHQQIIKVYEYGNYKQFFYFSVQYSTTPSLSHYLKVTTISLNEKINLLRQITQILSLCHQYQYVLVDIQSRFFNIDQDRKILLTKAPAIQYLKSAEKSRYELNHLLSNKQQIKRAYYLSPELSQGKDIDERSDLYALGIIFHEILMNKKPFQGRNTVDIAVKHLHTDIPELPVKFQYFQILLNKLLAKKSQDRFNNAEEVLLFIDELQLIYTSGEENKKVSNSSSNNILTLIKSHYISIKYKLMKHLISRLTHKKVMLATVTSLLLIAFINLILNL